MATLGFRRPFGFSSNLPFGHDASAATLAVTLAAPVPAILGEVIPPPVRMVALAVALPAPVPTCTLSRVHVCTGAVPTVLDPALILSRVHGVAASAGVAISPQLDAQYENNVWRGEVGAVHAPLQETAVPQGSDLWTGWVESLPLLPLHRALWGRLLDLHTRTRLPHRSAAPVDALDGLPWAGTVPVPESGAGALFIQMLPFDPDPQAIRWDPAAPVRDQSTLAPFIVHLIERDVFRQSTYHQAQPLPFAAWRSAARWAAIADRIDRGPWRWGRFLAGVSTPPDATPEPPQPPISNDLAFLYPFLLDANLEFARRIVRRIPVRRTYFVLHEIAITRVSDGAELHFEDLTLSADVGSWGWSLSGNALGDATYARLVASPFTEIDVLINGLHWRFLVTSVRHSRRFGSTGYSVTGVSPALALTAPLSDARSRRITAPWTLHQLADQEVENTAWAVSWNAPDWLIPGGVWQYSQQTQLQAIGSLAEAAGAFVQADATQRTILVQPRYPAWPWSDGWLFQSLTVPTAILWDLTRSPKPGNNYNAVYAAGTVSGGIMGYVRRAGSAGDIQPGAPITNTLITHVDGARAFGGSYLADHLDQADVSFSMILGGDAPLIGLASRIDLTEPGQDPQRLLTQAVSISVQRGNNAVTVTQGVKGVLWLS